MAQADEPLVVDHAWFLFLEIKGAPVPVFYDRYGTDFECERSRLLALQVDGVEGAVCINVLAKKL